MRRPLVLLLALVLAGTGLAGCGDDEEVGADDPGATEPAAEEPAPAPAEDPLAGRRFVVVEAEGHEVVPGTEISAAFHDGGLGVESGCNHISGRYAYAAGTLEVSDVTQEEGGCGEALAAQERWIVDLLTAPLEVETTDDGVVLRGDAGAATLVEEAEPPRATLVDTTWVLNTVFEDEIASSIPEGVEASVVFAADGTYRVSAGCNTGTGTYAEGRSGLHVIEPPRLTRRRCAGQAMEVEAAVVALLDGEVLTHIERDRLTLTDYDDDASTGLGFTAG